ncbi:hypothetical protein ACFQWH_05515 [Mycolicibacterium sp. GCM10028919]|uniref:hypothetical protein n=1 Tax=Mycolicibacterium sp. GCM10028919 TaxID=3273401 RepID=UPI00361053D7
MADPVPAAPSEMLIEVKAISLNFGEVFSTDNAEDSGDVPGWDSLGVVVVPAADGSGPPAGTRVVGAGWSQAWAQQRVLASGNVAVVPDALDFQTAAALPVAGVTALQIVRRLGPVVGRRVLITGASGGVGRLAVQLAARPARTSSQRSEAPSGALVCANSGPTRSSSDCREWHPYTGCSSTLAARC